MSKYVLALDQGTTSSRAIVFDRRGSLIATAQKEFQVNLKPAKFLGDWNYSILPRLT